MRAVRHAVCWLCLVWSGALTRAAAQAPATTDDAIRASVLVHVATVLFPAEADPRGALCIGVLARDIDAPPGDSALDPSPAVLAALRRSVPKAVARSTCTLPGATVVSKAPDDLARRPIVYLVGPVRRTRAGTSVTVAYWFHGLNGGGWSCEMAGAGGRWRVRDCLPLWIS
jgi:hypothetical protein